MVVERIGPGQYRVTSPRSVQYVDLGADPMCHCGDAIWRNRDCKHIRAAKRKEHQHFAEVFPVEHDA